MSLQNLELLSADLPGRATFDLEFSWMEVDNEWSWIVLWTNEAHFSFQAHVNAHNYRIRAMENVFADESVALHSAKVSVWCGR